MSEYGELKGRRTTTERGLGWEHQKQRKRLLAAHVNGTPCPICSKPMYVTDGLDADHSIPRSKGGTVADRLVCSRCNRSRQDRMDEPAARRCRFHDDCGSYHSRAW